MPNAGLAVAACMGAGILGGLFSTPLTLGRSGWAWESTWLVYSLLAYAVFPWLAAAATVPDMPGVLRAVDAGVVAETAVFGFLWGVGSQLFGLGIDLLGNSLGFALVLGLVASVGSLVPLLVLHSEEAATAQGAWNFAGLALVVGGLYLVACAGKLKEQDEAVAAAADQPLLRGNSGNDEPTLLPPPPSDAEAGKRTRGLAVCLLSGVFSAALNFSASFGSDISDAAAASGASDAMKSNAIWAVAMSAGALPNIAFCCHLLHKNGTWRDLVPAALAGAEHELKADGADERPRGGALYSAAIATAMAVLWFSGFIVYGAGTSLFPGTLGTVVGWPINMTTQIMVANVSGVVGGEWRLAGPAARRHMQGGLIVLVVAIVFIGVAGGA